MHAAGSTRASPETENKHVLFNQNIYSGVSVSTCIIRFRSCYTYPRKTLKNTSFSDFFCLQNTLYENRFKHFWKLFTNWLQTVFTSFFSPILREFVLVLVSFSMITDKWEKFLLELLPHFCNTKYPK